MSCILFTTLHIVKARKNLCLDCNILDTKFCSHILTTKTADISPDTFSIFIFLTHWGRVTYICISNLFSIGSDNGLSPALRQAIILTNAGILSIGPLETNFSEILIETQTFLLKKMHLKMLSGKWRPFCLGLNVLIKVVTRFIQRYIFRPHCKLLHTCFSNNKIEWLVACSVPSHHLN